jgi:hypothetical protein
MGLTKYRIPPQQAAQYGVHFAIFASSSLKQTIIWRPGPGVVRRSHQQVYRPELRLLQPKGFADAALDRVAAHRFRGMSARDKKTQPGRPFFAPSDVKRVAGNVAPHPLGGTTARNRAFA